MNRTYPRTLCELALIAVVCIPAVARGADVDDLKATYEQGVKALNALDVDGFMASAHDQGMTFGAASPFPVDGKVAQRQEASSERQESRIPLRSIRATLFSCFRS